MRAVLPLLLTVILVLAKKQLSKQKNPQLPLKDYSKIHRPCIFRETGKNGGKVCVCNSTYCDNVPRPTKVDPPILMRYTSSKQGLRFFQDFGRFKKGTTGGSKYLKKIYVNHQKQYQKIEGWGGAFTDSTGINIKSLDEGAQDLLMDSYFADHGIKYSLCRVPIGGTDFSTRAYSYDDTDQPDPELRQFKLADEDMKYKIEYMLKAKKLNRKLNFFGSTWTSPRWMKIDNEYSAKYSSIKKEYYQAWANYILKFLEEYMGNGIWFWGITTQNEPTFGGSLPIPIPMVYWNATEMGVWIGENLGPTIRNSEMFQDLKILAFDDQLVNLPWYPETIMRNPDARKYIDGIATHWYASNITSPNQILKTHEKFPNMMLLSTEACSGFEHSTGVDLGSWEHGENYGYDIIEDLNLYYSGWIDWNMVLDLEGGPTFINNFVDSPIIVNASAGEFYKQPMYYVLGHFSKFLPPGSIRIGCKHDFDEKLSAVAFTVPDNGNEITDDDGATIVVILNRCEDDRSFELIDDLMGSTTVTVPKQSISTLLYWPPVN